MTRPGQMTARPPLSPHTNLTMLARIGTNRGGSAIWRVACSCGWSFDAVAPGVRNGLTKCTRCQPTAGARQAIEILMLLPATYDALARKLDVPLNTLKTRIRAMKKQGLCHTGKWKRAPGAGSFQPVVVAGPGLDTPCTLAALTNADHKRTYRKRIRRAIKRVESGGKEDPRYVRHIVLNQVRKTVQRTLVQPQTWCSVLQPVAQSVGR